MRRSTVASLREIFFFPIPTMYLTPGEYASRRNDGVRCGALDGRRRRRSRIIVAFHPCSGHPDRLGA